jgi:general secretion pathway protein L
MQKLLGLDLGTYSVKAVEVENDYRTYRVKKYHEVVMLDFEGLVPRVDVGHVALSQLFQERGAYGDRVFPAFPALLTSIRFLEFFNIKKNKLVNFVHNEMEELSLIAEHDHLIDYQTLSSKEGLSQVLAIGCVKSYVESLISELDGVGQHPKIIDVDSLAFGNLIPYLSVLDGEHNEDAVLLIDFGHSKTTLTLLNRDRILATRTIRQGGKVITDELAKELDLSWVQANRLKHHVSFIDYTEAETEKKFKADSLEFKVAQISGSHFGELIKEILRTIHSFKVMYGVTADHVALSGGGSRFSNLIPFLKTSLGIPVSQCELFHPKLEIAPDLKVQEDVMMQSLALAFRGLPERPQSTLNFRRGELSLTGSYDRIFAAGLKSVLIFLGILSLMSLSVLFKWGVYSSKVDEIKTDYQKTVQAILGEEPRPLQTLSSQRNWSLQSYAQAASRMILQNISSSETLLNTYRDQNPLFPLEVLKEISDVIPKEITVDVTQFEVSGKTMTLVADTEGFSASEEIFTKVRSLSPKLFKTVERPQQEAKAGSEGRLIKFKIIGTFADHLFE